MNACVITSAVRTAVGAYLGSLKTVEEQELAAMAIRGALDKSSLPGDAIDQVVFGNVYGCTPNVARCGALLAGLPEETPAYTVDRQCASSLQAVVCGAMEIQTGQAAAVVCGGVENMSRHPYYLPPTSRYEGFRMGDFTVYDAFAHGVTIVQPPTLYPNLNMGLTAENLAERYGISRGEQDEFAVDSQKKAAAAMAAGRFDAETIPVEVVLKKKRFVFSVDEHPRPDSTVESLAKLRAVFKENGTVTAGNSSGMNDGASAVALMAEGEAKRRNAEPLARIVAWSSVGVNPAVMGIGPAPAIRTVLAKAGLSLGDVDLFEINEAFAAQSLAVLRELGMEPGTRFYERVNVNGGAIALGHALGSSGTRLLTSLVHEMRRRSARYGVASLCIGGGMGMALLVENAAT